MVGAAHGMTVIRTPKKKNCLKKNTEIDTETKSRKVGLSMKMQSENRKKWRSKTVKEETTLIGEANDIALAPRRNTENSKQSL